MKKATILILIIIPVLALGQTMSDMKNQSYAGKNAASLFDPSKLTMRHSYSFSYYSSGGRSGNIGMYMNSIEYAFSDPLKIRIDLGFLHTPSRLFSGSSSAIKDGAIVPGVTLDWRPTDNFNFRLDYRQYPESYWWQQGHERESIFREEENR